MNNVALKDEPQAVAVATPMEMIAQALANGQGVELIDKLMALQERWEANQGRKAFDMAISEAKAEIPVIKKNQKGHNSDYADFAAIAKAVDPILAQHGLSYRFRTQQDNNQIKVTCVLSHSDGHAEETTLQAGADTSGQKNSIQAIGSTLTYLQRYTLVQMLGLASALDDDGNGSEPAKVISDQQLKVLRDLVDSSKADIARFCKAYRIEALPDLKASDFERAKAQLEQKAKQHADS